MEAALAACAGLELLEGVGKGVRHSLDLSLLL
jgi:hypothetical protein